MIPFLDLKAQYLTIKSDIQQALNKVLDESAFILGQEVKSFEGEFAQYCNAQHGIAVNTGTSALHLALLSAGIGPGDEVITVPFTFVATVAAILYTGAKPVFVDIDPVSYTIDVKKIEAAITPRTKAILPVHLYGQPADMDSIMAIAKQHNLIVIEDACQAHGSEYKGRRVGSIGHLGCFSFYPGKNLGAYGEGGIAVTNDADFADKIRVLRDWGQTSRYHHDMQGFNYRMDGFQGAVLRVKLRHLEAWTEGRRANASYYDQLLNGAYPTPPSVMPYSRHVYHIYAIRVQERERVQKALLEKGVQTGIHYPIPVHLQKAYADLGHGVGDFPYSEKVANEVLSLPMYAELSKAQIEKVFSAVNEACNAG